MGIKKPYSLHKLSGYVGGDKNEILDMINIFIDTTSVDINKLSELAKNKEWHSVYKVAHRIKPSFDIFEMKYILGDLKTIELLARENDKDGTLVSLIQKFINKFDEIVLLLRVELEE